MRLDDAERFHQAAKMIEDDGCEGYFSCCQKFGREVAGTALVMWLRLQKNPNYCWPAPEGLPEEVNKIMQDAGRLERGS